MKTPDEIKKGLDECTRLGGCAACPYHAGWEGAMEFLKTCIMKGILTRNNVIEYLRIRERMEDWPDDQ